MGGSACLHRFFLSFFEFSTVKFGGFVTRLKKIAICMIFNFSRLFLFVWQLGPEHRSENWGVSGFIFLMGFLSCSHLQCVLGYDIFLLLKNFNINSLIQTS